MSEEKKKGLFARLREGLPEFATCANLKQAKKIKKVLICKEKALLFLSVYDIIFLLVRIGTGGVFYVRRMCEK